MQELGRDCDLLYVCPSNSALAHLPYLVALDNATRCAPYCVRASTRVLSHAPFQLPGTCSIGCCCLALC